MKIMSTITFKFRLLAILVCVLCALGASAYDFYVDSIYYNITGPNTVEVTSQKNRVPSYTGDVVIPETVTHEDVTYTVTSIGYEAFYKEAFCHCERLTYVYIPKNVRQIDAEAFSLCLRLNTMAVDPENPYFDSRDNCNAIIQTATNTLVAGGSQTVIPNTVETIGDYAFSYRQDVDSIYIPNSVKAIGAYAFYISCIHQVNFPDSLQRIGAYAFQYAHIKSAILPNTVTSIGGHCFEDCRELENVKLSQNLTILEGSLFDGCVGLKHVIIPNGVTEIRYSAFAWCMGLESIVIPASVTKIDRNPFQSCTSLTSMVVEEGNPVFDSRDNCNAIIETATNKLYAGCLTTVLPSTIDSIGNMAFSYAVYSGECLDIPDRLKFIGWMSFDGSPNLKKICGGDSLIYIEYYGFGSCHELKEIYLGKSLKTISEGAFSNSVKLTTVVLQDSVNYIGPRAFDNSKLLESFTCKALTPPELGTKAFPDEALANATLYVPMRTIEDYRNADGWKDFAHIEGIYLPVDANADGKINVSDINAMLNRLLSGEEITDPVYDMNCDGAVNVTDVMLMINYIMTMTE